MLHRIFYQAVTVRTTVWLHHLETPEEKARWDLNCFEQILEAAPDKTTAARPLTSYLTSHPSKTSKTCFRSKDELRSDVLLWTPTHGHTSIFWPAKIYIHQLCADTKCRVEDLPKVMTHRHGWRESLDHNIVSDKWVPAFYHTKYSHYFFFFNKNRKQSIYIFRKCKHLYIYIYIYIYIYMLKIKYNETCWTLFMLRWISIKKVYIDFAQYP